MIDAVVCAFNRLPEKRDDIIRMQERILWGPLEETNHEISTIDQRKKELETIISDYAETGHLDRRTLFLYSDGDGEMDEEKAIDKIGSELEVLDEKRNALLIRKGDLGIQEANLHTLLKLVNGIIMKEDQQTVMLRSGTDDAPIAREPACYDLADFYERTDRITQWGLVQDYDNDLVRRFVEKILVNSARIEVKFKGGISVEV